MPDAILVLNAGSSTLKFAVFEGHEPTLRFKEQVQGAGTAALEALLSRLAAEKIDVAELAGIGHRIVHGGTEFSKPVIVDDEIESRLNALRALAPLHQPYGLDALRRMRETAPKVRQVACFDTAFHATQPEMTMALSTITQASSSFCVITTLIRPMTVMYATGDMMSSKPDTMSELY